MLLVENDEFDFIVGVITFYIVYDYFTNDPFVGFICARKLIAIEYLYRF